MRPRESGDRAFLDDIKEACALILSRVKNKQLPDFISNSELQDSIVLRLIVIGEASNSLTDTARKRYPSIQWKDMIRLRDLAVHHYWKVDALKIWEIIQQDIPQLLEIL
jgi:uncharacterized protein with HEPN domain